MHQKIPKMYQQNIFAINYSKLKDLGISLLIFDLDNTIARLDEKIASEKVKQLVNILKKDFIIVIVSNSNKKRVEPFAKDLQVDFYPFALKPLTKSVKKIIHKYKHPKNKIAIIGDQWMSDMKLGNKMGLYTILIDPLAQKDLKITSVNRFFENKLLKKYKQKNLFEKGTYYE